MSVVTERLCVVNGCNRRHHAKGLCVSHMWRQRNGKPLTPIRAKGGEGHVNSKGYRILFRPTHPNASVYGYVPEHRLVMAEVLGRPLRADETVHHKER